MLASITSHRLNPIHYPDDNKTRRDIILKKMYEQNYISDQEYEAALSDDVYSRISKNQASQNQHSAYSYFTDALITVDRRRFTGQIRVQPVSGLQYDFTGMVFVSIPPSLRSCKKLPIPSSMIKKNYPVETKYSLEYDLHVNHADGSSTLYTERDIRKHFQTVKHNDAYMTIYSTKKEMKQAVKAFKKAPERGRPLPWKQCAMPCNRRFLIL